VKILGPEAHAEHHYFPVDKVQEQQGFPADTDKWGCQEECQERESDNIPPVCELSPGFFCINPDPFALFIDRCQPVAKIRFRRFFLLKLDHDDLVIKFKI